MPCVKRSFLSEIIGRNTYDEFKGYAKIIVAIGTGILVLLFVLSLFVHWEFISSLLSFVTGTSLLFRVYIAALILALDIEVKAEEAESDCWGQEEKKPTPIKYKLTIVWGVLLVAFGIMAIFYSNKFRKQYAFECETFLVDRSSGIYHLDFIDCEVADETKNLEKMKGFEIEEMGYTFCDCCIEWLEDAEVDYESSKYYRK